MIRFFKLSLLFVAVLSLGLVIPNGCKKKPTDGGGGVDSLRVTFGTPADGAVVKGPTALVATVTGANGSAKVKFVLDAVQVSVDSISPFEYLWDPTSLQNGSSHTLRLIATDAVGNADTTGVRTYIANYAKLTMTVVSPADGIAIAPGQKFSATIAGGAGGTSIDFKVDNVVVFSDNAAPYEFAWDPSALPSGSSHTVQLIAADTASQSVTSSVRTVYARWLPMVATITSPADSTIWGGVADVTVGVNGGAGGGSADFRLDGVSISVDNASPYAYRWDPTALANGEVHTFKVIVADTSGQVDTTSNRVYFAKWRLVGTGAQSPHPINVRNIFTRSTSTALEFRVEFDNSWVRADSVGGIDCALFLDTDQSGSTGRTFVLDFNSQPIPINDIGAEYRMIVGGHGDSVWTFSGGNWTSGQEFSSLILTRNANFFECTTPLTALNFPSVFNLVVGNVHFDSPTLWSYDWVPISGHFTVAVDGKYVAPTGSAAPVHVESDRLPHVSPNPF